MAEDAGRKGEKKLMIKDARRESLSNPKDMSNKREREKAVVELMITLYCQKQHKCGKELCIDCNTLLEYARLRSDRCPFMETKTFCSNCKIHCYKPDMREKIRQVMKFSGPRMIFYHPVLAIRHVIESKKEKRRLKSK